MMGLISRNRTKALNFQERHIEASKKNRSFSLNVKIMLFLFVTASYALFMYRSGMKYRMLCFLFLSWIEAPCVDPRFSLLVLDSVSHIALF